MTRSNAEIAIFWIAKIKRLIAQRDFNSAHSNIIDFYKFANEHNFLHFKYEVELLHT